MFLLPLVLLLLLPAAAAARKSGDATDKPRTILAIFPHPDDENMIGHVLARYARLGHKVFVIIATDGKYGTRLANTVAGEQLGITRMRESECACEKLGINLPIYLHIDRLDTLNGVRAYLNNRKKLLADLKSQIERLQPDVLITFGPDGEYGHSEHIVTGAVVVDLLLREGWVDKYPLYFPADKKEDVADDGELSFVDLKYLNLAITYTDEDEKRMFEAAKCYVSQSTPEEVAELIETESKESTNTKYFRRFIIEKGIRREFWDR
jgi:LmbE family N-acetylglucosaminyl deacetylase